MSLLNPIPTFKNPFMTILLGNVDVIKQFFTEVLDYRPATIFIQHAMRIPAIKLSFMASVAPQYIFHIIL